MIKAIETSYKGYRFRSRLEARWAVFFDALGVSWDYEPEGYDLGELGWYLPDFFIQGNRSYGPYIEIKGQAPTKLEVQKLCALCSDKTAYGAIVWGVPGDESWISIHKEGMRDGGEDCGTFAGYLTNSWGVELQAREKLAIIAARSARFEHRERPA
jgi:hypothetical protein